MPVQLGEDPDEICIVHLPRRVHRPGDLIQIRCGPSQGRPRFPVQLRDGRGQALVQARAAKPFAPLHATPPDVKIG